MNKKNLTLSIALGTVITNTAFATTPKDVEIFDINSIEYIEEEIEINLGFDVADYLPEDFNPYDIYIDVNAITYIEEEIEISDLSKNLPEGFDAYAAPTNVQSINYIDENDTFKIDFDTKKYLPKGFNPFKK